MHTISSDLIILALIAGFILFRLFTVLGRKDDDGNITIASKERDSNNIIDISSIAKEEEIMDLAVIEKDLALGFENILQKVRQIEPSFSIQKFLDGAKKAFEMILTSFSENDKISLKRLLSEDVLKQFTNEIEKRVANSVDLQLTIVSILSTKINNISLKNDVITIEVIFESQQIVLLKNDKGEIIQGNPSQIDNVEDTWSFSRELNGKNNWLLVKVNAA
ncbi:MAG: Tim44/TimA family putative adaptor protein [Pseudomonadota bacterium]